MASIKRSHLCLIGAVLALLTVLYMIFVHNGSTNNGTTNRVTISRVITYTQPVKLSTATDPTTEKLEEKPDDNHPDDKRGQPLEDTSHQKIEQEVTAIPPSTREETHPTSPQVSTQSSSCTVNDGSNGLSLDTQRHIVIVGGMSFVGAKLATYFNGKGYHVLAIEDLVNIDNNDLQWYRWTQLKKNRIPLQIIMLSRKDKLESLLNSHSPQAIIYIPTQANALIRNDDEVRSVLKDYASLLINSAKKGIEFVLVSHAKNELDKGWLTMYETLLSSLYKKSSIVRATNAHGPWQDSLTTPISGKWYIDDVAAVVHKALTSNESLWDMDKCSSFVGKKSGSTLLSLSSTSTSDHTERWIKEYKEYMLHGRTRNVTMGAYISKVLHVSQYNMFALPNKAKYFYRWFKTAWDHGMAVVLFHDQMTSDFERRLKDVYSKTDTVHVSPLNHMIINDQRFYYLYDYLLGHDDIQMAITTDLRDVDFPYDPAQTMALLGESGAYAGLDIPYFETLSTHPQTADYHRCFPSYPSQEVFRTYRFFNVGVMGGTRSMLLALLSHTIAHMDVAQHFGSTCCDMSTTQLILHTKFYENVFVGYPFNSAFFTQTPGPEGLAVRHKPENQ